MKYTTTETAYGVEWTMESTFVPSEWKDRAADNMVHWNLVLRTGGVVLESPYARGVGCVPNPDGLRSNTVLRYQQIEDAVVRGRVKGRRLPPPAIDEVVQTLCNEAMGAWSEGTVEDFYRSLGYESAPGSAWDRVESARTAFNACMKLWHQFREVYSEDAIRRISQEEWGAGGVDGAPVDEVLERLADDALARSNEFAEKFRAQRLIPFCILHDLQYTGSAIVPVKKTERELQLEHLRELAGNPGKPMPKADASEVETYMAWLSSPIPGLDRTTLGDLVGAFNPHPMTIKEKQHE